MKNSSKKSMKRTSTSSKRTSSAPSGGKSSVTFSITNDWWKAWGFLNQDAALNTTIHTDEIPAFIRAVLPKGSYLGSTTVGGFDGAASGGFTPSDTIVIRYDIRVPTEFSYGRGGYLPCFYGGRNTTKMNISCSITWGKDGRLALYTNFPNMMNEDVYFSQTPDVLPTDGQWHTIMIKATMNSGVKGNGTMRISLDGEDILTSDKMMFRTKPTDMFEGLSFNANYGSRNFSPFDAAPADTHIDFANMSLSAR